MTMLYYGFNADNDLLRQQEIFDGSYWADDEDDDHEEWEE